MAKVRAIKEGGYYDHRVIKMGEVFNMSEVDEHGFYLDEKGKRAKFQLLRKDGAPNGEPVERKCRWVGHVKAEVALDVDPREVIAALSGKNPGKSNRVNKE